MRRRDILKEISKLIDIVDDYNEKTKPHSEEDYWSGELYSDLCKHHTEGRDIDKKRKL